MEAPAAHAEEVGPGVDADDGRHGKHLDAGVVPDEEADHVFEALSLVVEAGVADVDELRHIGHAHLVLIAPDDALERGVGAAGLGDRLKFSFFVDDEDRLDVEEAPDDGDGSGDAAAPVEIIEIADGEAVAEVRHLFAEPGGIFGEGEPLRALDGGALREHALSGGGAEGVDHFNGALREFLLQHADRLDGVVICGGHAGGEAYI